MTAGKEVRDEAYARLHAWGPEFGDEGGENGLSNHGPMAVEVLTRRGLGDRVETWLDRYVDRLEPMPDEADRITEDTWADAMGHRDRVGDWVALFRRAVREQPWQDVLTQWWPRLLPAIASASTHGLIRTGHAVKSVLDGDDSEAAVDEVAHALGYWAARAIFVPGLVAPSGDLAPDQALARMPRLPDQSGVVRSRLARLADMPGWSPALASVRAPDYADAVPEELARLVEVGVRRYATHGLASPVLLVHVATAPNAMRKVLPALPQNLWQPSYGATWAACAALTAAYAPVSGSPAPDPARDIDTDIDGQDLMDRAAEHGDEHVIKFTDTALDAYARTPDPALLSAALTCSSIISPP